MPARSEVDRRFTWKSEAIFADADAWEAAVAGILAALPDLAEFKGHLSDSPDMLADWFEASEKVQRVMEKVRVYTNMEYSCDVGDQGAASRADRARSVSAQLQAAMSFSVPELIAIGSIPNTYINMERSWGARSHSTFTSRWNSPRFNRSARAK